MADFTKNYNLEKPAQTDFYNVEVQNSNMEKIDNAIAAAGANPEMEQQVSDIHSRVGTTGDTGGTATSGTLFGKLNAILKQFLDNWTVTRATKLDELTKIGGATDTDGTLTSGTIFGKLNTILNLTGNVEDLVFAGLFGEYVEYTEPGIYNLAVPPKVNQIKVTACGGGGGGGTGYYSSTGLSAGGAGGGGAAAISNVLYNVTGGKTIRVVVGKGGVGGITTSDNEKIKGEAGSSTVIGSVVTLPGGGGANYGNKIGTSGGTGGGAGGSGYNSYASPGLPTAGEDGLAPGGKKTSTSAFSGGGGGGSLGSGADAPASKNSGYPGYRGSGGSGSFGSSNRGGDGGDGYVKIEWVV